METKILDYIDFEKVNILLEGFNKSTGFVTAILDMEGNILSKSGWRQICTEFHRINPETSKMCTISDTELASKLAEGEKYHFYKCLNGLVDVAVPIVIKGEHIANLFSGQFFFEEPDISFFKNQAKKYGFDESSYLKALKNVPVVSREKVNTAMEFLLNMTQLISDMTFQKLEIAELYEAVVESEAKYRLLYESNLMPISIFDTETLKFLSVNNAFVEKYGYTKEEFLKMSILDIRPDSEKEKLKESVKIIDKGLVNAGVYLHKKKNGQIIHVDIIRYDLIFEGKKAKMVFANDITDRIEAEKELRISESKFRATAEFSPLAIYSSSGPDQKGQYVNPAFTEIFGFTLEDVPTVGEWWMKAFPDENYRQWVMEAWQNNIDDANRNNTSVAALECVCNCKDGSQKIISWEGSNIGDSFWAFGLDLTERKQKEESLKLSGQRYRFSLESTGQIGWSTPPDGVVEDMPMWREYSGQSLEEVVGWKWLDAVHPDDRESANLAWSTAAAQKINYFTEYRIRRADGVYRNFMVRGIPLLNTDGSCKEWVGTCIDITDRKQAEEELLRSQERFDLAMKASTDGLFDWNLETNDIYYAPAWKKMLGYEDHELPNDFSVWETTTDPEDVKKSWELQQKLISNQIDRFVLEFKMKHKDGHWVDILSRAEAIFNDSGKAIRIVGTHTDITDRKNAEEEIKKQLDELRRWYKVTLDRESRVLQLKQEVNELLKEHGEALRYGSSNPDNQELE